MLDKVLEYAYCIETDTRMHAKTARFFKDRYHFVCTDERCLKIVVPARSKNDLCFFRRKPEKGTKSLHAPNCAFFKEDSGQSEGGSPKYSEAYTNQFPIPNILGKLTACRSSAEVENIMSDEEKLHILVSKSGEGNPPIYGSLQEVVEAWDRMESSERRNHTLKIGGQESNYEQSFIDLASRSGYFQNPAQNKIVVITGFLNEVLIGNNKNGECIELSVDTLKYFFKAEAEQAPKKHSINYSSSFIAGEGFPGDKQLSQFEKSSKVFLFCLDPRPINSDGSRKLLLPKEIGEANGF